MTTQITEIETTTLEDISPYEDYDGNRLTHIVRPEENKHLDHFAETTGQDIVNDARMLRVEITALCGHKFIPDHNPEKFPACKLCIDIAGHIMRGLGE